MNTTPPQPDAQEPPVNLLDRFVPNDAHSHVDEAHDEWLAGYDERQMELNEKMRGMKL